MSDTETDAVLAANAAFYDAMRRADLHRMDRLWARRRPVSCTHSGRPMIFGRASVMESWRIILTHHDAPDVHPREPCAVVTGRTALVLCVEQVDEAAMLASNSFVIEDGQWRMLTHQAAHLPVPDRR